MARTRSADTINKSDQVQRFVAKHPTATATEVYEALTGSGVDISLGHVKRTLYGRKSVRGKPRRPGRKPAVAVGQLSLEHLLAAKRLVAQLGSVASAKQAVDALARLNG